jgi:serine/threonine-protein kinase
LPANRVIHFLTQACASLVEAHALQLIHRDLKPENMMICNRGGVPDTLKVLDFGVATMMTKTPGSDSGPMAICGTPYYMSPEAIVAPQTQGIRSDLYSLGAVGYYLLTGKTLFSSTDVNSVLKSQLMNTPLSPSTVLGRPVDADLEALILQCLEKSPEARPANAEELSRKLNQCTAAGTWNPYDAIPATPAWPSQEQADTVESSCTVVMPAIA